MAEASSSSVQNLRLKLQKHSSTTNGDIISSLPDSVLCRILSFLPTNEVVRASILSSRWRYLWTNVPNLHFEDKYVKGVAVDRVMIMIRVPCIKKFSLRLCEHHDPYHVNAWICAAMMRNVEELHLSFNFEMKMKLPPIPYYCEKLVVLKLRGPITLDVTASVCFRFLKILHFDNLSYLSGVSIEQILSSAPVLEDFSFYHDVFIPHEKQTFLRISSSSLKKLAICKGCFIKRDLPETFEDRPILYIDTPKLEVLKLNRLFYSSYEVMNLYSLVKADINVMVPGMMMLSSLVKLLRQMPNVKVLCLSSLFLKCPLDVESNPITFSRQLNDILQTLHNLTHFDVEPFGNGWLILPGMLESSPNLESLVIKMDPYGDVLWFAPEAMPQCMLCLKRIVLKGFKGCKKGMELAEYFLKNSMVLKKMIISWNRFGLDGSDSKDNIVKKLLMFPKASSTSKIVFYHPDDFLT